MKLYLLCKSGRFMTGGFLHSKESLVDIYINKSDAKEEMDLKNKHAQTYKYKIQTKVCK